MINDKLSFKQISDTTYSCSLDKTWSGVGGLVGGFVQTFALAAMQQAVGDEKKPLSINTQFLRPLPDGEATAKVNIQREGRALSNVNVEIFAQDKLCVSASAIFANIPHQANDKTDFAEMRLPEVDKIGKDEVSERPKVGLPAHEHFDFFYRRGSLESGAGNAFVAGWLRPNWQNAESELNEYLIGIMSDLWVPASFHRWERGVTVVGLESSVYFRAPQQEIENSQGEFYLDLHSKLSANGVIEEDGLIWNREGTLLSQYRQLRMVIELPPKG